MDPRLLCCVIFCLLAATFVDTTVKQNPRYKLARVGKPVNLICSQTMNHDTMYWYQKKPNQAPKLLLFYYDKILNREADTFEKFQSSRPNNSFCSLYIGSAGLEYSAMYLCASSRDTG
ncbi:mCG141393, partial [Mus musculus]